MKNLFIAAALYFFMFYPTIRCYAKPTAVMSPQKLYQTSYIPENKEEKSVEINNQYNELIEAARDCIIKNDGEAPANYDFSSVIYRSKYDHYETLGYWVADIDGNGINELIFGGYGANPDSSGNSIIYDVYTISDGELIHVLDGWERNRFYLCENGMIANEGSGGASNSSYSYFVFDGSKLQLAESVIYDGAKDPENPWFYSTVSQYDAENVAPISEEAATELMEKYVYTNPPFTPFAADK